MNRDVNVRVIGTHRDSDGICNEVVSECDGIYALRAGKHFLIYNEELEGTTQVTRNLVTVGINEVVVSKSGAVGTRIEFAGGTLRDVEYDTGFGKIHVNVRTKNIMTLQEKHSLRIVIDYNLEMDGEVISECKIDILATDK